MLALAALSLVAPLCLGACAQLPPADEGDVPVVEPRSASSWLAAGAQALAAGEPTRALPALLRYRSMAPNSATGAFLEGVARLDLGQPAWAADVLEEAVSLSPNDTAALSLLARVSFELGDGERGVELLEQVVSLDPEDAASQTALGLAYLQLGEFGESYRALMAAVASDPERASAHVGLGRLLGMVGDLEAAALAYRTALDLTGDQADTSLHVSMGHVLRDLDRPEEALASYLRARANAPNDPWIAANLASTFFDLGRLDEARDAIELALSQLSGDGLDMALVHLNHGLIMEALGDPEAGLESLRSAVLAEPALGRAQRALAKMLLDLGRDQEAREQLVEGLAHNVLDEQLVLELALLHERFGDSQGARQCAEILESAAAGHPRASLAYAELRLRSRQAEVRNAQAAERDLRVLSAGPMHSHAHAWALLGAALAQRGAMDEAAAAIDRGLALVDESGPAGKRYRSQRARLLSPAAQR